MNKYNKWINIYHRVDDYYQHCKKLLIQKLLRFIVYQF